MINAVTRHYPYYTIGGTINAYGQPTPLLEPTGTIKMAIYLSSQTTTQNIKYSDATYVALTQDANVNDTYVIEYEGQKLKVLYVNKQGRFKQVYLAEYGH